MGKARWWLAGTMMLVGVYFVFIERWVPEEADWFGRTGLSSEIERELPKYLRREFGESWVSSKYLKASDLHYLGAFPDGNGKVHFWRVPWGKDEVYAHVTDSPDGGLSLGWGGTEKPPSASAAQ